MTVVVLLTSLSRTAVAADHPDSTTLLGKWRVIKMEARGESVSEASWQEMKFEFKKDEFKMWASVTTPSGLAGKPPLQCSYSLDNVPIPHHFNFAMVAGESRRDVQAIYQVIEEKLYLCLGKERPKSFDTKGTESLCYVLQRLPETYQE